MKARWLRRGAQAGAAALTIVGGGLVGGCLTRPLQPAGSNTTATVVERLAESAVTKIDLLFMVDNSPSMADKQAVLATAVPDLIGGLVNPACVDDNTLAPLPASQQPQGPLVACPAGSRRDFPPIVDIHIGMITSSLGTFGATGCNAAANVSCTNGQTNTSKNDQGHLVTRTDPCGATPAQPTYDGEGFLQWDPSKMLSPPGIASEPVMEMALGAIVTGGGQYGCGFESQNESWYRFLVDPSPLQLDPNTGPIAGKLDEVVLSQRQEFLRSDSLLAIVVLTDETDVSIRQAGGFAQLADEINLPRARSECTTKGPADPCCSSCGEPTPKGCSPTKSDPICSATPNYDPTTDNYDLHAFGLSGGLASHKARFGVEFFYQPSRYVEALTSPTVVDVTGQTVPNPIYTANPSEPNAGVRGQNLVFYATITGVPWQLIARQDADGTPDLLNGVDPLDATVKGGFKTFAELSRPDKTGKHTFWDDIAGDPEHYVPPISPFMQESTAPRAGTDPITGVAIEPPSLTPANTSASPVPGGTNALNGHEYSIPYPPGDIEYGCVFTLAAPVDCSKVPPGTSCDCSDTSVLPASPDNPLCSPNPNDGMKRTVQTSAKAYPGTKNLAIAKGMAGQGIAASICPAQLSDDTAADYGYRPAVSAIISRLKQAIGGQCLPRQLTPNAQGEVQCLVLEGIDSKGKDAGEIDPTTGVQLGYGGACDAYCNGQTARQAVQTVHQPAVLAALADPSSKHAGFDCFCEIQQLSGTGSSDCAPGATSYVDPLQACECDASDPPLYGGNQVNGWCYVDATTDPPVGNPSIVQNCPTSEKRLVRFVGEGAQKEGSVLFITCAGD